MNAEDAYKAKYKAMKEKVKDMEREYDRLNIQLAKINASIRRIKLEKRFVIKTPFGYCGLLQAQLCKPSGIFQLPLGEVRRCKPHIRINNRYGARSKWFLRPPTVANGSSLHVSLMKTIDDDIDMVHFALAEGVPGLPMNGETPKRNI
ncbi:uncharacterized protein SPPG_09175 [Spizellomyces punctatus DAOM BR117]|uniref:INO80 complex subunit F domain-containing protein n=1 Tax=Spizellomyces punctatus (strain DAOM BR117) TaxID=645134 RepID=A0A0L0HIS1_SPIPD|nr:uncharacterized protein SPPG_09175 [Spizellomyces punctatus DAOM BR117]KND01007.1 hypothetical protein SPPG_09175 [Spizellomyces punctatus DAOM BR117]|eukprot:XP_016609046.1 hypothetical protein SPPG_09175 [Spizellomyces punctatus DAOM BR117]